MRSASRPGGPAASPAELLQRRALEQAGTVGYTFLDDAGEPAYSYGELDGHARRVAAALQEHCRPGDRALLLLPPGLDYVAAFYGCLYAGVVAVPAYPPRRSARRRSLERLVSVITDAGPRVALTVSRLAEQTAELAADHPVLGGLRWIAVDTLPPGAAGAWRPHRPSPDALAFLQYTSGSTAAPKGVMVTNANLLCNAAHLERFFEVDEDTRSVIWLPPYHDMGLVGGLVQPLYTGYPVALMSPARFVRRPLDWLAAISRLRATVSGGPSFAYELCARRIRPEQVAELDLASWRAAFNGAEPVQAAVLERFAEAFAPAGFRREAFYPCYGLAEATLIVTGGEVGAAPVTRREPGPLERVGCGWVHPDQRLVVADPATLTPCEDGVEGEILVAGPSVARGYWRRPRETAESFEAYLAPGGDGPFLRTGDLGVVEHGELYVTGRIKDLLILRGVNHHPQDVEQAAAGAHPALEPGGGAAFTVTVAGVEQLVVAHEIARGRADVDAGEVCAAIRSAVSRAHDLSAHAVVLLRPGGLPKTSSGKVQRYLARDAYTSGALDVLGEREFAAVAPPEAAVDVAALRDAPAAQRPALVAAFLRHAVALRTGTDPDAVDLEQSPAALGLDSLATTELQHELEDALGAGPALSAHAATTLAELAGEAVAALSSPPPARSPASTGPTQPASHGQRALWFLDQLSHSEGAYNLAGALRLPGGVDVAALEEAFRRLVERHAALRTTFRWEGGGLVGHAGAAPATALHREAFPEGQDALERELGERGKLPFDLEHGPLLRVHLWTGGGRAPVLLVALHHIAGDFFSLGLMLEEVAWDYGAVTSGSAARRPPAPAYADFVARERAHVLSPAGRRSEAYWLRRLGGDLAVLDLPTDRARPHAQTYEGDTATFTLDAGLAAALRALARASGTTLYTVLLAAYEVLLHRYTGQRDILVGSPTAGRGRRSSARTVGYFVNPVVVRGDLGGNPPFRDVLRQLGATVAEALAHRDYPFPLIAERLQPVRDPARSPLFQTMFIFQQWPEEPALAAAALGRPGLSWRTGGLELESVAVPQRAAQFDLTLTLAEGGGEMPGALQYATALFDRGTVTGMAEAYVTLLRAIAADPGTPIGTLPLLDEARLHEQVREWNDTAHPYPAGAPAHDAFARQAARRPGAVAVSHRGAEVTYGELERRANRIAQRLIALGVEPEDRVGVCLERSADLLAALLGILEAGAAYVPLDPSHPADRLGAIVRDADIDLLVTRRALRGRVRGPRTVLEVEALGDGDARRPGVRPRPAQAAYVMYTSGSSGAPKGVVVPHGCVVNFFAGMDERVGCGEDDVLLAVTSIGFDISLLELLWTVSRGARVVMVDDEALGRGGRAARGARRAAPVEFSLFYFASAAAQASADAYRLVLEGARFADRNGFAAVWTPERHFHPFGGLYPNPSVLSAALATVTERVALRAGSVVLPLHSPLRVAEEWAVVDNLSGGRTGIAFASGWHADDFAFFPERYAERKEFMFAAIDTVQRLWRGESTTVRGGAGNDIEVRVHPAPVQRALPTWITAAGSPDTFVRAGEIGANVLTHLLGQSVADVGERIERYRDARARGGHDPEAGVVTLMLHTFVGDDAGAVRASVHDPFKAYLRSSVGLVASLVASLDLPLDLATMSAADMDGLLEFAFDRYFETSALFGTRESLLAMVERLGALGVDEIACLVDFGVPDDEVLGGLEHLAALRDDHVRALATASAIPTFAETALAERPTLLQATPTMMRLIALDERNVAALGSLRTLLLGGEALPPALAREVTEALPATLVNMYGPTETTIWSSTHEVTEPGDVIPIGTPIANTEMYVVGREFEPVPVGVPGELLIGGDGVTRGYWRRGDLTAERFVPDPFGRRPGARLYRTGDLARYRAGGTIEFLGRADRQVKVRGFRVEPAEIEAALARHDTVRAAVVAGRAGAAGDVRLVAYVVPAPGAEPAAGELLAALRLDLPEYMVPASVVTVERLPLGPSGKIDLSALPDPDAPEDSAGARTPPRTDLEQRIAALWRDVLHVETVGIYDNFFDLGGHSLLMAQVHALLRAELGEDVPLIKLLEHPTVSSLAAYLSDGGPARSYEASQDRARKQRASRGRRRA
jgi:natural product biosynthesis luciferase-like monooxygenase protein